MEKISAEVLGYRLLLKQLKSLLDKAARGEGEHEDGSRVLHARCYFCGGQTLKNGQLYENHESGCEYEQAAKLYDSLK